MEMRQELYSQAEYPQSHPDLANSFNNLGDLLQEEGNYTGALDYYRKSLESREKLYPRFKFSQGHPELAASLSNLGDVHRVMGHYPAAREFDQQCLAMYQNLADIVTLAASEAEALNFASRLPSTRDGLLSVTRYLPGTDAATYADVWRTKAAIMFALQRRQVALRLAGSSDPEFLRLLGQLEDTRRALSHLLLNPTIGRSGYEERVQEEAGRKEDLERKLAHLLPETKRELGLQRNYVY
jgi:tetratricopeptide (TPR) repeat protein